MLELAFGYLLSHQTVASVIAGATKPEQIDANIAAAGWQLSSEEIAEVQKLTGK
jgi:aryl-alcohol dehydrogenase-like predicted oxidoreductase